MRIKTTARSDNLPVHRKIKQAGPNGNQESDFHVSNRPQFRASNVMAYALALYNVETAHTISQTMNMALRQFLPPSYVAQAERLLRNRGGLSK
jgi:hypothetical protein